MSDEENESMKKFAHPIANTLVTILIFLAVTGYLTLVPKPLETPEAVASLAQFEAFVDKLTGYNGDSPPGLSLVVIMANGTYLDREKILDLVVSLDWDQVKHCGVAVSTVPTHFLLPLS